MQTTMSVSIVQSSRETSKAECSTPRNMFVASVGQWGWRDELHQRSFLSPRTRAASRRKRGPLVILERPDVSGDLRRHGRAGSGSPAHPSLVTVVAMGLP